MARKPSSPKIQPGKEASPAAPASVSAKERLFWADAIAKDISADKPQVVSDAKTPSGVIHVGALRGVILHDVVHKALLDAGFKSEFIYRFDDFDPMDSLPSNLPSEFEKFMGKPLCEIPSPEAGAKNYAQLYARQFQNSFERLGCHPTIAWSSEDYRSGRMNELIRIAIEKADAIRKINEKTSGGKKEANWLPVQIVCEGCGRIGTTKASDFDGKTVAYECAGAKYSKGCGFAGRRSPFNGGSKLTWKVHWAADFKLYGVTVEGAGKDHYTVGGSREVADEVSTKVFNYAPPYDIPYEFFLVGGKKMSSSKGVGSSAQEISEMMSPEIVRNLIVRYKPRTAINFSPFGDTIPRLYDDYDSFADTYFGRKESRDPDEPRIYQLSQVSEAERRNPTDCWRPGFSLVAFLIQVPHVSLAQAMEKAKGAALTERELSDLKERERAARSWLEKYADASEKLTILSHTEGVKQFSELSRGQQNGLAEFADFFATHEKQEEQAAAAREFASKHGISVKEFFEAAYLVIVGRKQGPRLLPFLAALDRHFVVQRLKGVQ